MRAPLNVPSTPFACLKTVERVCAALDGFRRHLSAGVIVLVEPWYGPGVLLEGAGTERHGAGVDLRVTRTAFTRIVDSISSLHFSYRIEEGGTVRTVAEVHELGLFTNDEMLSCFARAGLVAEHEVPGLTDRGLYVARESRAA